MWFALVACVALALHWPAGGALALASLAAWLKGSREARLGIVAYVSSDVLLALEHPGGWWLLVACACVHVGLWGSLLKAWCWPCAVAAGAVWTALLTA